MKAKLTSLINSLFLNKPTFVNFCVFLYLAKCLIISVSYQDAVVFLSLVGMYCFKTYNKRYEFNLETKFKEETQAEIKEIKKALSAGITTQALTKLNPDGTKRYFS